MRTIWVLTVPYNRTDTDMVSSPSYPHTTTTLDYGVTDVVSIRARGKGYFISIPSVIHTMHCIEVI